MRKTWKRVFSVLVSAVMVVVGLQAPASGRAEETDGVITLTEESQLGQYTESKPYNRVSVHDPSVVVGYYEGVYSDAAKVYGEQNESGTRKEIYFIFGSHMAWAYSLDLMNWKTFENNITVSTCANIFKEDAEWSARGVKEGANYDVSGNLWAPDVIWNPTMNKWCMYMSVNGDKWYTSIVLLTSDSLNGDWTRVGPVVYSGFTNKEEADKTDLFDVIGAKEGTDAVPKRYLQRRNNNATYNMNAIDPCVVYDEEGKLWMTYGSWFGGIYMLELDPETGLRDYGHTYETEVNVSDAYQGLMLAGGDHRSGEASYLEKIGDRWYLFLSYGGLEAKSGYNMRVFSSDKITGPYKDLSGEDARYGSTLDREDAGQPVQVLSANVGDCKKTTGSQLMNYYRWDFMNRGFAAEGHNSAFVDDDGKAYVVYHTRFDGGTEAHEVRVHQLFTAKNGGLVAAPFEYAGETLSAKPYDVSDVAGEYTVILQKPTNYASLECRTTETIELKDDGTVSGAYTGTWEQGEDGPYVTMKLGNDTYQGVFLKQKMEEQGDSAICFTLAGDNDLALWGYKLDPTVAIRKTLDQSIQIPSVTATDITLPTEGVGGCTIAWKSNGIALSDDGKITYLKEDSDVVLTAVISNGKYRFIKNYTVKVFGSDSVSKEQEIELATLYADEELDISKMSINNYVSLKSPFYKSADLSHGAVISFDIKRTAASGSLANIFALNFSGGAGTGPMLYFCGAGYLGYNGPGGYYDANRRPDYSQAEDLFKTGEYVNIKIKFTPDGFEVYRDGELAYSRESLVAGTTEGATDVTNWSDLGGKLLDWLENNAEELNFGAGSWSGWSDQIFQGSVKNMKFSYVQPAIEVNGSSSDTGLTGLYTQDYEDVSDISKEWTSPNAQQWVLLGKDEAHGNFLNYNLTGSAQNSRGAYSWFGDKIDAWPENYQLEYDMALTAGNEQESQFAVATDDFSYTNKVVNDGIASGYVLKMTSTKSTTWSINDGAGSVVLEKGEWVHVKIVGTAGQSSAKLTITKADNSTPVQNLAITAVGAGNIKGFYIRAGRYNGIFQVDNICVKEQGKDYVDTTVYDTAMKRAKQFASMQEENAIFTEDSYQALKGAIETAEKTITPDKLTSGHKAEIDAQAEALIAAIDGLKRLVYTVTVETTEGGSVTGLNADGKYYAGDSIALTAKADEGYEFAAWEADGKSAGTGTVYSAMASGDIAIKALFEKAAAVDPPEKDPSGGDSSGEGSSGGDSSGGSSSGGSAEESKVPAPTVSAVTYRFGLTLKTVTLPADWEWKNPDEKLSAGTKAYTAVYKKGVQEENVLVTVNKADNPSYVLPGDLSGTAGESLGSISLPEGWVWKDAAETLAEDKDSYQAVYTDPSGNYETIEAALDVDVSPNGSSSDSPDSSGSGGNDGNSGNGSQDGLSDVSLTLNKSSVTLYTGKASESVTVKATVKGTSQAVTWTSSNPKVATVEDGLIAAVKKGTAVITASAGGISKTVRVTVKNPSIKVKKGKKLVTNVKVGEKEQIHLKVSVSPAKSGLSIEKLSKKKKKIVKVTLKGSSLTIKGKKKGKATIWIKSGKAEKAVKVTVK